MKPVMIAYDLGTDAHGRAVRLSITPDGASLSRDAGNQRDDSPRIDLSRDQAAALAEILSAPPAAV
ncbi:hypothetical protein ACFB49_42640 [Sphingomonas sp. DBB INV C78]|uniref:hypothetical protein n=1 Tax=Sphingomonas sp. DBB INV C78 TaxID=3349434 RepID=UPI0036D367E0